MDRRSWPWRKKPSDRSVCSNDSSESTPTHSSRNLDYQDLTTNLPEQTQGMGDGPLHWQEYEQKIKDLSDKLAAALVDVSRKELLAKQHAKVAEEAVSGWETVEAEAATLKQQLEATIQQKLASEDRVSHLDGALKECMRQLRSVREEQEENIHKAIVKKTRDWDRLRSELEEKLADWEQRFLAKDAENRAMARSLQERGRSITEIGETLTKAETKLSMLQVRVESLEKEKVALKYELNVSHKELEIRNEERALSKRAADVANKQHLEDTKRIAKLEAECQHLRSLVRKKLPGPGALAQMKLEVEGLGSDKTKKKKSRGETSPRDSCISQDDQSKEESLLAERYSATEEETKMLREILAKRNNELQSARLMCARTASKLSTVEQQLEALKSQGQSFSEMPVDAPRSLFNSAVPGVVSLSEDGKDGEVSCAESWASALIAELDLFKKGKLIPNLSRNLDASRTSLDEFMEMEQLASMLPPGKFKPPSHQQMDVKLGAITEEMMSSVGVVDQSRTNKAELHEACGFCTEMSSKLAIAEEELAKNATNQASLVALKKKLALLFETVDDSGNVAKILEQIRVDIGVSCGHSLASIRSQLGLLSEGGRPGEGPTHPAIADPLPSDRASYDADAKAQGVVREVTMAICKVAELIENLATEHQASPHGLDVDDKCDKLIEVSKQFLSGQGSFTQWMTELSLVLNALLRIKPMHAIRSTSVTRKCLSWGSSFHTSGEMDFSGVGSPMSDTSKSDGSEAAAKIVPAEESSQTGRKEMPHLDFVNMEEELRKLREDNAALEAQAMADNARLNGVEQELLQIKQDKLEMESTMQKDKQEMERLRTKLDEVEGMLATLGTQLCEAAERLTTIQTELASAKSREQLGQTQLSKIAASKKEVESQLHACTSELCRLQEEVEALEKKVLVEQNRNSDLEAKCKEYCQQLQAASSQSCSRCGMVKGEDEQACREMEIAAAAEKLAECERTILVLGQQLKSLASPNESANLYPLSSPHPWSQVQSERYCTPSSPFDDARETCSSLRFCTPDDSRSEGNKKAFFPWDPRQSLVSDVLDSELMSLSLSGQASGRNVPTHEDYIAAVAEMPSSPEADPATPGRRGASKPPHRRKKRSSQAFAGVDMSKSMNDADSASSTPTQKHGSSFSRFFARTKSSH